MEIKKIQNKKSKHAQGHVEMIISFLIFIGFISTLFFILNPTQSKQIDYTILSITEEKLTDIWSEEYSSVSVIIDDSVIDEVNDVGCFHVPNSLGLSGNLIVKDENGNNVPSSLGSRIRISHPTRGNRFYKIYASDAFPSSTTSCSNKLLTGEYNYGSLVNFDVVMKDNLYDLVEEYNADYEGLKESLGLSNDFMIFVYDTDYNLLVNASQFVPRVVEIVARDIPVVALDRNADPTELIINLRTW